MKCAFLFVAKRGRVTSNLCRYINCSITPHTALTTITSPLIWQRRMRSPCWSPLAVNKDSKYWICLSVRNLTHGLWTCIFNVTKTTLETFHFRACLRTSICIVLNKRICTCSYNNRDSQWFHYLISTDAASLSTVSQPLQCHTRSF
jgi:hypothetical protein